MMRALMYTGTQAMEMRDVPEPVPAAGDVPLRIKSYTLGPYATNCYLLWVEGGADAWIVDASFGPGRIVKDVKELGLGRAGCC